MVAAFLVYFILTANAFPEIFDEDIKTKSDQNYPEKIDDIPPQKIRTTHELLDVIPYRYDTSDKSRRAPTGSRQEQSTLEVLRKKPIKFGGRSDIPPLWGKMAEYRSMLREMLNRETRLARNNNHHIRFGRSDPDLAQLEADVFEEKRGNHNFLRYGRSFDSDDDDK